MRREQRRTKFESKADRNLAHAFTEIRRMAGNHDLPTHVRDRACKIMRTAQDEDLLLGRSLEAMAAASLYAACRGAGLSRQVDTLPMTARCQHEDVRSAYSVLNRELALAAKPITEIRGESPRVHSCLLPIRLRVSWTSH
jgi:transcription initiation factor TFIIB